MGKIVQPLAHQLLRAQEEIDRLRKLNSELEIKNLALRNRLARYERVDTENDSKTRSSQDLSPSRQTKQYQKSTRASRSREVRPNDNDISPPHRLTVTIQGTRLEYSEGVITKSDDIRLCWNGNHDTNRALYPVKTRKCLRGK